MSGSLLIEGECEFHLRQPLLRCTLDSKRSRNQRQGCEFFSRQVEFMRWFSVAFLTDGVFKVIHGGIEQITPVL